MLLIIALIGGANSREPESSAPSVDGLIADIPTKLDLDNPYIADTAMTIAADYPGEYSINQISAIYNSLTGGGWYYYSDPNDRDYFQNANTTLQRGKISNTIGRGDCDDFAILMASLINSIGGSVRINFAYDVQNKSAHAYAEVYLGNEGDPGVIDIRRWLKDEYNVDKIIGINRTGDEIWLNLDWSKNSTKAAYPGGPYFGDEKIIRYVIWESSRKVSPKIVPVIETMDNTTGWEMVKDDKGSTINITSTPGKKRNGIQISYDLKDSGWVGISKKIDPMTFSDVNGLNFSYFLISNQNPIELRMIYDDDAAFSVSWSKLLSGAWSSQNALYMNFKNLNSGNSYTSNKAGFDTKKIKKIEFVISDNRGNMAGPGTVILDDIHGIMAIPSDSPWERAEKTRQDALSRKLVVQAKTLMESQVNKLPLSVQLSIEALMRSGSSRLLADQSLRNGLALLPRSFFSIPYDNDIIALDFSPDGRYLAIASGDTAQIYRVQDGKMHALLNHSSSVTNLAFSFDGKYLATASRDKTARLWDPATGKELVRMNHDAPVVCVAFSPDGKELATTSYGRERAFSSERNDMITESNGGGICLWNTITGKKEAHFGGDCNVVDVVFGPDGRYLATRDINNVLCLWQLSNGQKISLMINNTNIFALSPDSKYLAIAENDLFSSAIRIWDISSGSEVANYSLENYPIDSIAFSPNNTYLAAVGGLGEMPGMEHADSTEYAPRLWQITNSTHVELLPYLDAFRFNHRGVIHSIAFSPDEKLLATSSADHTTRIWDMDAGKEIARISCDEDTSNIIFSPDGRYLATASGKIAGIWGTSGYHETALLVDNDLPKTHVALSPDGRYIATTGGYTAKGSYYLPMASNIVFVDTNAQIWEVSSRAKVVRVSHKEAVNAMAFSNDGKYLATASSDNTSKIWEIPSGKEILSVSHDGYVNSVAFSPDGKMFATAGSDKTARLWDLASGKELVSLIHNSSVNAMSFSSNGMYLATGDMDGNVWVWDAKDYRSVEHLIQNDSVWDLAFSPDGRYLIAICGSDPASWIWDHVACVWDINEGREIRHITNEKGVQDLEFSPDGRYLGIAYGDGIVRIEEVSSGQEVAQVSHDACVFALTFSANGRYLATGSGDRTARVWLWRPMDLITEACSRLGESMMTIDEWTKFLGSEYYCQTCDANCSRLD